MAAAWPAGLAPIAVIPGIDNRWVWAPLLCVVVAALLAAPARTGGRLPRAVVLSVGSVLALLGAAALGGAAPLSQVLGRAPRYEGAVALAVLCVAAALGARLLGPSVPGTSARSGTPPRSGGSWAPGRHVLLALSTGSVLLAAVALLELTGLRPLESDLLRPGSLAGNATDQGILGAVLIGVLGFVILGAHRRGERISVWLAVGAAAGIVSVVTSASRAGLLALALVLTALLVRAVVGSRRRLRAIAVAVGVLAVVAGTALVVPLTRQRLIGAGGFAQGTIGDRFVMWEAAWRLVAAHPLRGVGPSGFADAVTPVLPSDWFTRTDAGAILDSPHNVVLQAGLAAGIPGVLAAGVLAVVVLIAGIRRVRREAGVRRDVLEAVLVVVPAAGAALLTHVSSPKILLLLALLVGALVAAPAPRPSPARTAGRVPLAHLARSAPPTALVLGAVFLVVCIVADAALLDGRRAAQAGDVDRADAAFRTAYALRPWDVDIPLSAARGLGETAEVARTEAAARAATDWAERAVELLPASSLAQYTAGMVALEAGDAPTGRRRLAAAAALSPSDPRIHHYLGVAALLDRDPAAAARSLERALALAPDSTATRAALRDACRALGDEVCAPAQPTPPPGAGRPSGSPFGVEASAPLA